MNASNAGLTLVRCQLVLAGDGKVRLGINGEPGPPYDINYNPKTLESKLLSALVSMARDQRLNEEESRLLGESLYHVLLDNPLGDTLDAELQNQNQFVRLELSFEDAADALVRFPWEYLFRPVGNGGYYLSAEPRLAIVRRPTVGNCRKLHSGAGKAKILIVASSPSDKPKVEFEELLNGLQKAMPELDVLRTQSIDPLKRLELAAAGMEPEQPTWDAFRERLKAGVDVVHFIGHGAAGGNGGIAFVKSTPRGYEADIRTGDALAKALPESVRLVFLQACETSMEEKGGYKAFTSVATCLAEANIPAIVAMQSKVTNVEANRFASAFYTAVFQRQMTLDRAVQEARGEIVINEEKFIPTLYLASDQKGTNNDARFFGEQDDQAPAKTVRPPTLNCAFCGKKTSRDGKVCQRCKGPIQCVCSQPIELIADLEPFGPKDSYFCNYCGREYRQSGLVSIEKPSSPPAAPFPQPPSSPPASSTAYESFRA